MYMRWKQGSVKKGDRRWSYQVQWVRSEQIKGEPRQKVIMDLGTIEHGCLEFPQTPETAQAELERLEAEGPDHPELWMYRAFLKHWTKERARFWGDAKERLADLCLVQGRISPEEREEIQGKLDKRVPMMTDWDWEIVHTPEDWATPPQEARNSEET